MDRWWLLDADGFPSLYQEGNYLYSKETDECRFWIAHGYVYDVDTFDCPYYIQNGCLYRLTGGTPVWSYAEPHPRRRSV